MSPAIFVELAIGAAWGSSITSATALTLMYNLHLGWEIAKSLVTPRLHHQLMPMRVDYQSEFSEEAIEGLKKRGHDTKDVGGAGSVAGPIAQLDDGRLMAKADYRKARGVDAF